LGIISPIVKRRQQDAAANPAACWGRTAAWLPWFRPRGGAFVWAPPTFLWFAGGLTNLSYNAIDLYVARRAHGLHLASVTRGGEDQGHSLVASQIANAACH
jgi:hypothetical protein